MGRLRTGKKKIYRFKIYDGKMRERSGQTLRPLDLQPTLEAVMSADNPTKLCVVCGTSVGEDHYQGVKNKHKECHRKKVRENRAAKIEYYREYDRKRSHDPKRVSQRGYSGNGKIGLYCVIPEGHPARGSDNRSSENERYRKRNPKKRFAHEQLAYAIRTGKVVRSQACEVCRAHGETHGHHHDYEKPLDVWWLCASCHKQWHRDNGEGANA